jgi:hypothetical protein
MSYSVKQIQEERDSFGPYRYRILKDGIEFAIFSHDYRGECAGIELDSNGRVETPPFGMSSNFLTGGGLQPVRLTKKAVAYLDRLSRDTEMPNKAAHRTG